MILLRLLRLMVLLIPLRLLQLFQLVLILLLLLLLLLMMTGELYVRGAIRRRRGVGRIEGSLCRSLDVGPCDVQHAHIVRWVEREPAGEESHGDLPGIQLRRRLKSV